MTRQSWSDAEVVGQICQGDRSALVRVYDEYSGLVYGIALRILRSAEAAEDVVQDVFLQLWRNPSAFDSQRGKLAPWLAVITRHKAVDALRKLRLSADPPEDASRGGTEAAETPSYALADAEKAKTLMARLPQEQRRALEMAFLDGLTHGEIAERTGEPLGTVKSRIRLGLGFLRKELAV